MNDMTDVGEKVSTPEVTTYNHDKEDAAVSAL
jgi:hypothetical protein